MTLFCLCAQAAKKAGLSDGEIKDALEMAASKEIKDKLKEATQTALDYGVGPNLVITRQEDAEPVPYVITLGDSVEPFNWTVFSGCITSAGLWLPPVGVPPERKPRDLFWIGQI